ncbi:hypothetical protein V6N13_032570 [Hibiscus sabdariffa]
MPLTLCLMLVLIGALCSLVYIFGTKNNKNGRKLPPGPRSLPIIGSLHMLGKLPHQNLHHLAKRYGPIMSLRLGSIPTIVISSPQAAQLIFKTHDLVFASRPKMQASEYLSYGSKGMAFTPYGSYWRTVRKWCTLHLLTSSKVEYFAPTRKAHLGFLVESLKKVAAVGETVDLTGKIGEFIEDTMCQIIFGRTKDDRFNLKSLIEEAMHLHGLFNISDFIPYLAPLDIQGIGRRLKRTSKSLDMVLEKIIDEHVQGADLKGPKAHRDFVDVMLSVLNQPMDPHDEDESYIIQRENIKAITLDMIAASFETSAVAIVNGTESIECALQLCSKARRVWEILVPPSKLSLFDSLPFENWLLQSVKNDAGIGVGDDLWNTHFAVTCWLIWKSRCANIFGGVDFNSEGLARHRSVAAVEFTR